MQGLVVIFIVFIIFVLCGAASREVFAGRGWGRVNGGGAASNRGQNSNAGQKKGDVKILDKKQFRADYEALAKFHSEQAPANKGLVLYLFADYCGFCKDFNSDWAKIAQKGAKIGPHFMKYSKPDFVQKYGPLISVKYVPTILKYSGGQIKLFTGNRSVDGILKFAAAS